MSNDQKFCFDSFVPNTIPVVLGTDFTKDHKSSAVVIKVGANRADYTNYGGYLKQVFIEGINVNKST